MPHRHHFLVCYDIADPSRLQAVHRRVMAHAIGGQKSLYECWLSVVEHRQLWRLLHQLIVPAQDSVHFYALDSDCTAQLFGVATQRTCSPFLIV